MNTFKQGIQRPLSVPMTLGMLFAMSPTAVVLAAALVVRCSSAPIKMSDGGVSGGAITTGVGSSTNVKLPRYVYIGYRVHLKGHSN